MKKNHWKLLLFVTLAFLLTGSLVLLAMEGVVLADETDPEDPEEPIWQCPPGLAIAARRSARGRSMRYLHYDHETMLESLAEQSGIDIALLTEAVENREDFTELLSEAGFTEEEVVEMVMNAHIAVIEQMLEDGVISEEQAEKMRQRADFGAMVPCKGENARLEQLRFRFDDNLPPGLRRKFNPLDSELHEDTERIGPPIKLPRGKPFRDK
ncbi:MAG TPA: hypothetical protein ENN32_03490 [Chloroflexi bacterium]|nr:hypothetical protein [Chloroflexota bacterium]